MKRLSHNFGSTLKQSTLKKYAYEKNQNTTKIVFAEGCVSHIKKFSNGQKKLYTSKQFCYNSRKNYFHPSSSTFAELFQSSPVSELVPKLVPKLVSKLVSKLVTKLVSQLVWKLVLKVVLKLVWKLVFQKNT